MNPTVALQSFDARVFVCAAALVFTTRTPLLVNKPKGELKIERELVEIGD